MNSTFIRMIYLLPLLVLAGCASQYDCYPCGKVSCSYCPLKAMPYTDFQSSNCNGSIGQTYLANLQTNPVRTLDSETLVDSYYLDDSAEQAAEPEKAVNDGQDGSSENQ